jgi:hypothetical protein
MSNPANRPATKKISSFKMRVPHFAAQGDTQKQLIPDPLAFLRSRPDSAQQSLVVDPTAAPLQPLCFSIAWARIPNHEAGDGPERLVRKLSCYNAHVQHVGVPPMMESTLRNCRWITSRLSAGGFLLCILTARDQRRT